MHSAIVRVLLRARRTQMTIETIIKLPVTRINDTAVFAYDGNKHDITHLVDDEFEIANIPYTKMGKLFVRAQVNAHYFKGANQTSISPSESARAVIDSIFIQLSPTESLEIAPTDLDEYELDSLEADLFDVIEERQ